MKSAVMERVCCILWSSHSNHNHDRHVFFVTACDTVDFIRSDLPFQYSPIVLSYAPEKEGKEEWKEEEEW